MTSSERPNESSAAGRPVGPILHPEYDLADLTEEDQSYTTAVGTDFFVQLFDYCLKSILFFFIILLGVHVLYFLVSIFYFCLFTI